MQTRKLEDWAVLTLVRRPKPRHPAVRDPTSRARSSISTSLVPAGRTSLFGRYVSATKDWASLGSAGRRTTYDSSAMCSIADVGQPGRVLADPAVRRCLSE